MKKLLFLFSGLLLFALTGCSRTSNQTYEHALERANAYAAAINNDYREPEKIYAFLTEEMKAVLSEEAFCACWEKERTYPYITPLYLFYPELTLSEDAMQAQAVFQQAARIIGMEYTVQLVYENGDYYVDDWHCFADGSYLEKFKNIPYQIDWYYDIEDVTP